MPCHVPETLKPVECLAPAADAAGRNGTAVSLKNVVDAFIVVHVTQGNAATIALTPQQCSDVSGTGAKAIPATPIWANLDTAASDALVRAVDAASYTTDAGVKNKIVIFHIDPATLDTENGFDCLRCNTGASNAANITQIEFILAMKYGTGADVSARVN